MNRTHFPTGSVVIPVCHDYPDGALVVDGYDDEGRLLAHPQGGGPQHVVGLGQAENLRLVTDAERQSALCRHTHFALETAEGVFAGWTYGKRWNGWAMPYFVHSEAELVARVFDARYDAGHDAFVTKSPDAEEEVWSAVTIQLPDGTCVKAYPIGSGAWMWDEVKVG